MEETLYKRIITWISAVALLGLACVGTDFVTSPVMTVPPRVTVTPVSHAILIGSSTTFQAVYYDSLDTRQTVTFQWASSDTGIASVTAAGLVAGHQAGQVDIRATAYGITSSPARLTVVTHAATQVATVTIAPDSARLAIGDSLLFTADVRALDGTPVTPRPWSGKAPTLPLRLSTHPVWFMLCITVQPL